MTVLLLLLSMSIAFGVAYINLPGSRYRASAPSSLKMRV